MMNAVGALLEKNELKWGTNGASLAYLASVACLQAVASKHSNTILIYFYLFSDVPLSVSISRYRCR